jgi:hypothetical protein
MIKPKFQPYERRCLRSTAQQNSIRSLPRAA